MILSVSFFGLCVCCSVRSAKIFKHFGFLISHLKRTQYEKFSLAGLEKNQLQEIPNSIAKKILEKAQIDKF